MPDGTPGANKSEIAMNQQPHWTQWRNFLLSLLILIAVSAGGYAAFVAMSAAREKENQKDPGEVERPPVPVRVARAEKEKLQPVLEVIGTVLADPEKCSTLTAATSGMVDKLVVREGTRVAPDDEVIRLDARPAQAALNRAEAAFNRLVAKPRPEELTQARSLVAKMKAAHALAESRLHRTAELRSRSPELVPELQWLDEQRNEQTARSEWDTAQAQLQLLEKGPRNELRQEAQVEVDAAKLQLQYCHVISPIAGEVADIKARVGQRADLGTPLITILDTSEVFVQARVPGNRLGGVLTAMTAADKELSINNLNASVTILLEKQPIVAGACCSYFLTVPKNAVATIRCPAFPGEVFPARSGWLNQQTESSTGDVPIKLRVPNPRGLLRPGMTVKVELHLAAVEGIAIPEDAVTVNENGHRVVTLVRDKKALPTEITLASETEPEVRARGLVRVLSGLEAGDKVAIENGYALPKDTPVSVLPPRASADGSYRP